jgi:hypothetical protein
MLVALQVQQHYASKPPGTLDETDKNICPPEEIPEPIEGNEKITPVDQNSRLDQGENRRIATAVDKNKLAELG